jgi:hypothetical protein
MRVCVCVCVCVRVCVCVCVRAVVVVVVVVGWNLTEDANIHFGSQAILRLGSECSLRVHKDPQLNPLRNYSHSVHFPMQLVLVINN